MLSVEDNKDKIIKPLSKQVIEVQQRYDKAIKERDNETYDLQRKLWKYGEKIVPSCLKK